MLILLGQNFSGTINFIICSVYFIDIYFKQVIEQNFDEQSSEILHPAMTLSHYTPPIAIDFSHAAHFVRDNSGFILLGNFLIVSGPGQVAVDSNVVIGICESGCGRFDGFDPFGHFVAIAIFASASSKSTLGKFEWLPFAGISN